MCENNTKLKSYKFRLDIDGDNIPSITGDIPGFEHSVKKPTKLLAKAEVEKLFWNDWMGQKTEHMPIEVWFINEKEEVVKILRCDND